jgi:hypothetical protein
MDVTETLICHVNIIKSIKLDKISYFCTNILFDYRIDFQHIDIMKCGIGDKVRFLNDVGGGTVTKIIDKKTVAVQTDDGFEIPVLDSELIIIGQGDEKLLSIIPDKETTGTKTVSKKPSNAANLEIKKNSEPVANCIELSDPHGSAIGLFLAFVPNNLKQLNGSNQNLYIVNDSDYRVFYSLSLWNQINVLPLKSGLLLPDSKELIKEYGNNELNNHFTINVQSLFFKNTVFAIQQPEYLDLNINPIKLFKESSFAENDFFDEKAYIIAIVDSKNEKLLKKVTAEAINESVIQKDAFAMSKPQKQIKPEIEEIDLHIHELVENHVNFSNSEIIQTQLARFETALEGGIRSNSTKKMVFIHGLGNGKLKHEIRKILETKYSRLKFQDASFKEYGYGATLVYIR